MKKSTINNLMKLNQDLYESQASQWSNTRRQLWEKPILDFIKNIKPNSKVLDLGCGNARLYQILSKINIDYLGIDPSKNLISLDKKNYPKTKFKTGDGLSLNYENKFNYIFNIAVLQHIPSQNLQIKFLSNCKKALTKNGQLILTVWNRHQPRYKKYFLKPKLYPDMQKNDLIVPWKDTCCIRFIHAFNLAELSNLARKVGFKNIKCYYINKDKKTTRSDALNILLVAKK